MPKVLIVDDDPALCKVLTALLNDEGFQVQSARNGREGLDILRQEGQWIVLLDLMMPYMDGRAVLQAMRAERTLMESNKVVLMSAAGNLVHDSELLQEPAQAILSKPFELESVLAIVNQLVSSTV